MAEEPDVDVRRRPGGPPHLRTRPPCH